MDLNKLPTWSAYVFAPLLLLISSNGVIRRSESPLVITAIAIGCGLGCAGLFQLYLFVMRGIDRRGSGE